MTISWPRVGEAIFAGLVTEGAAYLTGGVAAVGTAFPLAIATASVVYKTGISVEEATAILDDIKNILSTPTVQGNSVPTPSPSEPTPSPSTPSVANRPPKPPTGFSPTAAKAAGYKVFYTNAGTYYLYAAGVYYDVYGKEIAKPATGTEV